MLGTDKLADYLKKYKLSLPSQVAKVIKAMPERDLEEFINKDN